MGDAVFSARHKHIDTQTTKKKQQKNKRWKNTNKHTVTSSRDAIGMCNKKGTIGKQSAKAILIINVFLVYRKRKYSKQQAHSNTHTNRKRGKATPYH